MTTIDTEDRSLWKVKSTPGGDGEYELCPPGNYPAVIVGLFDIGHQEVKYKDEDVRQVHQLVIVYELVKKRSDGDPHRLAQRLTWSCHPKSGLTKLIVNVTGIQLGPEMEFDPRELLGIPVMVMVTNRQSGDRTFHELGSISQFPEEFPRPIPRIEPMCWSVRSDDPLPKGLGWVPFVYGKSIRELASSAVETKDRIAVAAITGEDDKIPF